MTSTNDLALATKAIREVESELARKLSRRRRMDVMGMLTVLLAMRANLLSQFVTDLIQ